MIGFGGMGLLLIIPFFVIFGLVVGLFVYNVVKGISENKKNQASPVLDVAAKVVSKRMLHSQDSTHFDNDHVMHTTPGFTHYWVTFQFPSGDRSELAVPGREYGLLAEGDEGMLRFQGSKYISFIRTRQ